MGKMACTDALINLIRRVNDNSDDNVDTADVLAVTKDLDDAPIPGAIDPPQIDPTIILDADVSDHWGTSYALQIRDILNKHRHLFRPGIGRFSDGIEMPIPFKDKMDLNGLKQTPFALSKRDRDAMDSILDPMKQDGLIKDVPLDQPSPVASPAFVVYQHNKLRVVIDLRRVNAKLIPNVYPLPRQDDILGAMGGAVVFSSLDIMKGFFNQPIRQGD